MAAGGWDFEARSVVCTLSLRAVFHPDAGGATVSLPWLDGAGQVAGAPVALGPLSGLEADAAPAADAGQGGRFSAEALRVKAEKDLGSLSAGLELAKALAATVLPVSVQLGAGEAAASAARIHLGPLLVASEGGDAGEASGAPGGGGGGATSQRPPLPFEVRATWTETIGVEGLYLLDLRVRTDKPFLSPEMRRFLMPLCFTVDAVKSLPNEPWLPQKCEGVRVEVYPQVSRATAELLATFPRRVSAARAHGNAARFLEPVVWLLGLAPAHTVREWLQHEGIVVEVHDRDPRASDAPSGGEAAGHAALQASLDVHGHTGKRKPHPHGVARFLLGPLVGSKTLQVALRSDVFPGRGDKKRRRAEQMSKGLRAEGLLEEEGQERVAQRAALDKREDTTDYHARGTVCTARAALAAPLPDAAALQAADEERNRQRWAGAEQLRAPQGGVWAAPGDREAAAAGAAAARGSGAPAAAAPDAFRAKVPLPAEKGASAAALVGPWRSRPGEAEEDERRLQEALASEGGAEAAQTLAEELGRIPTTGLDCRYERFGRIVLIVDERESTAITGVINTVRVHNGGVKGIDSNSSEINTYQLSEEEKHNPHLDLITGFAVLDGRSRLFVLEGLRERGLQRLLEAIDRNGRPNTEQFRLLHNPAVGYCHRLYADFGLKVKQIKIRLPLEQLAVKPELYSAMGIMAEDTTAGMQAPRLLMELKQMSRMRALRQGAAFPKAPHLVNLEILYGGYVTAAELAGDPAGQASGGGAAGLAVQEATEAACLGEAVTQLPEGMSARSGKAAAASLKAPLSMENGDYTNTLQLRQSRSMPNFIQTNREFVHKQSTENEKLNDLMGKKRTRQTPFLEGKEVYLYSSQKLNCTEMQKEWMRKHMETQVGERMWTYNATYNSTTFEFAGAAEPGVKQHVSSCPNDTYARLEGDTRSIWRNPHARPPEDFKQQPRDLHPSKGEELHEAFVEQEWFRMPVGDARRKPIKAHVRFEPERVPHHRVVTERPFDASEMQPNPRDFGPKAGFESVHYHGRPPGEDRYAEAERHNVREREKKEAKIRHGKVMRSFSQGTTRHCVTDLDRRETILKDAPYIQLRGRLDGERPVTIDTAEYHEHGMPAKEWHARLRENDATPPYEVHTGAYLKRDPEVGTGLKRSRMSGTLGKAPWRHGADGSATQGTKEYPAAVDFNLTRQPPQSKLCENQLWKNASRTSIAEGERTRAPYRRPVHFGVDLLA